MPIAWKICSRWRHPSHFKCLNESLLQCAVLLILMFLGLPDPSLFYLDSDPNPSTNKLKILKNLDFVTSFLIFLYKIDLLVNVLSISKKQKYVEKKLFLLASCQPLAKNAGSGSADPKFYRSTTLTLLTMSLLCFLHLCAVYLFLSNVLLPENLRAYFELSAQAWILYKALQWNARYHNSCPERIKLKMH